VIKTCQHCGAVNGDASELCCFCDAPLSSSVRSAISRRATTHTEGNLAVDPDWRHEVSTRLRDYRARRRGSQANDVQTALPFESTPAGAITANPRETAAPAAQAPASRGLRSERFEISIPSLEAATWAGHAHGTVYSRPTIALAQPALFPVALLPERQRAALLDGMLLLFSFGGMLALFTALGGHIGFDKLDLSVAGATFALFYAQYFALFTIFGGSTPGMMVRKLRVVSFDGGIPTSRQMVWRSFGYLVSAGTCFLGFLWALWDEDHLCWQDRISQTYLTPMEQIGAD
jgi:uncharacterized RDD family membrane protein YckC